MPKEVFGRGYNFLPKSEILSFEEVTRLAKVFVGLGVQKLRITGGEPLLRRDIELIAQFNGINGLLDIALTTNGSALEQKAEALFQAGLRRVTVSLDSLDDATFRAMNDVDFPMQNVLRGIDAALDAGFEKIKINMVVKRGINEEHILPMVQRFCGPRYVLRFIEYMDVGNSNGWRMNDVVTAQEIVDRISAVMALRPLPANYDGETALRYALPDGGEIGIIASVTKPFCQGCTRARLTADGKLYTCLFATTGHDLRAPLRSGAGEEVLSELISTIWQ
jgi:GTP 3',8-cyclase